MTASTAGRSLELYFIDGKPDGMQTAEVFNWTGHVLMTPRTRIAAALARKEAKYTGIHLLLGETEDGSVAYIGEAASLADRIRNHDQKKDWWSLAVLVTTGANNLNKAHVRYLEARLLQKARQVGRVVLENGNAPNEPGLNEAAQANMEAFLDQLLMVLPALRIDMFVENTRPFREQVPATIASGVEFRLANRSRDVEATALFIDGEFIVQAGSQASPEWQDDRTKSRGYARLQSQLKQRGLLRADGHRCVFVENYAFQSPSAAAAVVCGRQANGPRLWRNVATGQTYKEWEAQQLDAQSGAG